jgi:hypothetical protein
VAAGPQFQLEGDFSRQCQLAFGGYPLQIVGVEDPLAKVGRGDVLEAEAGVFERHSIDVERPTVGREHVDGLRYDVRDPAQLRF